MAEQLLLVQRDDFTGDINSLNLLNFAAGFELAEDGYVPADAGDATGMIWETIPLMARGATQDALAGVLQALEAKREQARWYKDGSERYGVWLRSQLSTETGARQAFIEELSHRPRRSLYNRAVKEAATVGEYLLAVKRALLWERTAAVEYSGTAVDCLGGMADYTAVPGEVAGDVPARLAQVQFRGVNLKGGLSEFWLGFRSTRFGTRANFQSSWSLRKAAFFGTDTTGGTTNADASAVDGYKVVITFAGVQSILRRATIKVSDVTANPTDQRGRYVALLRAKLASGATGTFRVRLADGYYTALGTGQSFAVRSRVAVTGTSWLLYELGEVQIPSPGRLIGGSNLVSNYALGIDAERIAGSGNLELDCIILVPCAEGFVYASTGGGVAVEYSAGDERPLYVHERPNGTVDSVWLAGGLPQAIGTPKISGGGLPVGAGTLVLAAHRPAASTKGDQVSITMWAYPRWTSLRGAE